MGQRCRVCKPNFRNTKRKRIRELMKRRGHTLGFAYGKITLNPMNRRVEGVSLAKNGKNKYIVRVKKREGNITTISGHDTIEEAEKAYSDYYKQSTNDK